MEKDERRRLLMKNVKLDKRLHANCKCLYDELPCDHFIAGAPACHGVTFFGFGERDETLLECPRRRD